MTRHDNLLVETVTNGPFVENCYIVADIASSRGILVDPGDEQERILARVREQRLELALAHIINTHAHIDHVGAVADIKAKLGIDFWLHPAEGPVLQALPMSAQLFGLPAKQIPTVDQPLDHGQRFQVGALEAEVIHTPGHSPGGCCFYFAPQAVLIAGDTLFAGSIGRTDLPGGDSVTLLRSIRERLFCLPDDVVVYPGHGPATTIGAERQSNPFLQ